jgi:hypothetical protein
VSLIVSGRRFTRWTVTGDRTTKLWRNNLRAYGWICICECGKTRFVAERNLISGISRSCGCLKAEKIIRKNQERGRSPYHCRIHGLIEKPYRLKKANGKTQRACDECRKALIRGQNRELKAKLIAGYGSVCECCGDSTFEFMTIDHIDGTGGLLRQTSDKGSAKLFRRLIREGFPRGTYRLLCMNCNWARGVWGYCPHEKAEQPY